jgi:hypothetical protein
MCLSSSLKPSHMCAKGGRAGGGRGGGAAVCSAIACMFGSWGSELFDKQVANQYTHAYTVKVFGGGGAGHLVRAVSVWF